MQERLLIAMLLGIALGLFAGEFQKAPATGTSEFDDQFLMLH